MGNRSHKALAFFVTLAMTACMLVMLPAGAFAATTDVASVTHGTTTTKYTNLSDAIDAAVADDTVKLLADAKLEEDATVLDGVAFDVPSGLKLTVPAGTTLTLAGDATISGTTTVEGSVELVDSGIYKVDGTVSVSAAGTFNDKAGTGMAADSTGVVDFVAGSFYYAGAELYIGPDKNTDATIQLSKGTIEFAAKDSAGLYPNGLQVNKADSTATLTAGKTVSVFAKQKLMINGTFIVEGTLTNLGMLDVTGTVAEGVTVGTIDNSKGTAKLGSKLRVRLESHSVMFDMNSGILTLKEKLVVHTGNKVTLPEGPTRDDYNFDGWVQTTGAETTVVSASLEKASITTETEAAAADAAAMATTYLQPGDVASLTEDTTFTAHWTQWVTATFNTNGGSSVSSQDVLAGAEDAVAEPTEPTRDGYEFSGWYTDSALTKAAEFPATISEDTTYYAKWTAYVTATFNSNGGTTVLSQKVLAGAASAVVKPTDPTKTNAVFDGWYTDSALSTAATFPATINENTTYYAKWKTNVTASFVTNGGTTVAPQTVVAGQVDAVKAPTSPTKTGYIFVGWYSDSALATAVTFPATISIDTVYYAKWAVAATATFNSNGGTSVASQTVATGTAINAPTAPTRSGYTFVGWYTDSALSTRAVFPYTLSSDTTFYARWTIASNLPGTGQAVPIAALVLAGVAAALTGAALMRRKRVGGGEQ